MTVETLITGCELYMPSEGWWVHGDLHRVGTSYVFNAVLMEGEAAKQFGTPVPKWSKVLTVDDHAAYFERRGVFVFSIIDAQLNEVAREYLNR